MSLAPPLLELEHIVNRVLAEEGVSDQELQASFAHARDFLLESTGLFREVEETLFTVGEDTQKLDLCRQEMNHSLVALQKLEDATLGRKMLILKERLQSFLISRTRCLEYFGEFSRLATEQPIYSPVPVYDSFIKAGVKVLNGQLSSERLSERFPDLMPELHKVQQLVTLLPKLHQVPADLLAALNQGLEGLQTGYGALSSYFENQDKVALEDGLKLLGSSSTILAQNLEKAEVLASSEVKYSSYRPAEEWLRLKNYIAANPQDKFPESWITSHISKIFYVWDFVLSQAQSLLHQPLLAGAEVEGGVTQELLDDAIQARTQADQTLASLNGPKLLTSPDQVWLEMTRSVEKLSKSVEVSHMALAEHMAPFKELPGLEVIAGLKEQVKRGDLDKSVLATEFHKQLEKVEELIKSVENAKDPISKEFRDLLPLHRSAFLGMLENLEAGDWYGLDSRWQGVLSTLPHLANLSRTIRTRLTSQGSSSKLITCLRCQAKNDPDRRVCSTCGASLPTVIQKRQVFSEIDTSSPGESVEPPVTPKAIDLLESLVQGLEENVTSKKDAADALSLLIKDVDRQRQMFTKKLLPLMGKETSLDSYLRFFAQGLGQYFANLMDMHSAVEEGALARVQSALVETRETLATLDAMKERVDGALRG